MMHVVMHGDVAQTHTRRGWWWRCRYKLKAMFQSLLDTKADKWDFCKNQV